jgi:hypothetical protein
MGIEMRERKKPSGKSPVLSGKIVAAEPDPEIVRMAITEAAGRAAERQAMIATAAYFRAETRGFEPGHELEDWLAAEAEVTNLRALATMAPAGNDTSGSMS